MPSTNETRHKYGWVVDADGEIELVTRREYIWLSTEDLQEMLAALLADAVERACG